MDDSQHALKTGRQPSCRLKIWLDPTQSLCPNEQNSRSYNFDINQRSTAFSPGTGSKYFGLAGPLRSLLGLTTQLCLFRGRTAPSATSM